MKEKIVAAQARYSAQVDAFLNELAPLGDELLNRKPAEGGWSAMQILHHLILVEENSMAYIRKKLSFNPQNPKSGASSWLKMIVLHLTLRSPIKFKAPKSAGSERIPDHANFAETRAKWQKIQGEWADFFEKMPPELLDKAVYRHPRVGLIGWPQVVGFIQAHFERHRRQARRAIS